MKSEYVVLGLIAGLIAIAAGCNSRTAGTPTQSPFLTRFDPAKVVQQACPEATIAPIDARTESQAAQPGYRHSRARYMVVMKCAAMDEFPEHLQAELTKVIQMQGGEVVDDPTESDPNTFAIGYRSGGATGTVKVQIEHDPAATEHPHRVRFEIEERSQ